METLLKELKVLIVYILKDDNDFKSLCALEQVNKEWHGLIAERDEGIWKTLVLRNYNYDFASTTWKKEFGAWKSKTFDQSWNQFNLHEPIVSALSTSGFDTMSSIQRFAIPPLLQGRNVMIIERTGMGKTTCFYLALLQSIDVISNSLQYLTIHLTRELARQQFYMLKRHCQDNYPIQHSVAYGGVPIEPRSFESQQVLSSTLGRLVLLYEKKIISFESVKMVLLDEIDMKAVEFRADLIKIIKALPKNVQYVVIASKLDCLDFCKKFMKNIVIVNTIKLRN